MYNVSDKFKEHVKNNGYIEKKAKSAKEPVAKLKWSDFELEPLKPNLVKNGWDDFEPYGSGKNYVIDYDESKNRYQLSETLPKGTEVYMIYYGERNSSNFTQITDQTGLWAGEIWWGGHKTDIDNFYVRKSELVRDTSELRVGSRPYKFFVCKVDDPIMFVEKKSLGNGLTRVQTWGGNSKLKLRVAINQELVKTNSSVYIKNKGKAFNLSRWVGYESRVDVDVGYEGLISSNQTSTTKNSSWRLNALKTTDNLDFIASDPVIVEGDEPNPVLVVDDLGNGKSKIRVFGANENTKLVHRSTKGIKGEPYTVKTNIDNKGNQLQLDTNLDEQSETIKKGNNDVKLEGKLKDNNIEIKLGRG